MASILISSLLGDNSHRFDATTFDKEVSRDFDTQEISKASEEAEKEAKKLASNKEELRKLIGYIDLTTLAGDDTKSRVTALLDKALAPSAADSSLHCGAVCVYPARVADVKRHLTAKGANLNIASVAAGFPSGQYRLESRILEIELAVADGATEIDIVINRAAALDDDWQTVYNEVYAMKKACGRAHLKTILATGELKSISNVYKASWVSILAGSDFIKTSTGKETINATPEVAFVMLHAIKRWYELTGKKVGFKPAGGIRTAQEALVYVALVNKILGSEWLSPHLFRIGASSLLDDVLKAL